MNNYDLSGSNAGTLNIQLSNVQLFNSIEIRQWHCPICNDNNIKGIREEAQIIKVHDHTPQRKQAGSQSPWERSPHPRSPSPPGWSAAPRGTAPLRTGPGPQHTGHLIRCSEAVTVPYFPVPLTGGFLWVATQRLQRKTKKWAPFSVICFRVIKHEDPDAVTM